MITCTYCQTMFIALFTDDMNQDIRCASNIFERDGKKYLIASYGSKFDGNLYEVLTDKHESGIICDACIIDDEQGFKLLNDNRYFGIDL